MRGAMEVYAGEKADDHMLAAVPVGVEVRSPGRSFIVSCTGSMNPGVHGEFWVGRR